MKQRKEEEKNKKKNKGNLIKNCFQQKIMFHCAYKINQTPLNKNQPNVVGIVNMISLCEEIELKIELINNFVETNSFGLPS